MLILFALLVSKITFFQKVSYPEKADLKKNKASQEAEEQI